MNSTYDLNASDNDSADLQLLAELEATPSAQPYQTSAVESAGLLNAARVGKRGAARHAPQSSPVTESSRTLALSSPGGIGNGKAKAGKLKRPNFMTANLAKIAAEKNRRRRDVYAMSVSPQKQDPKAAPTAPPVKKRGRPAKARQPKATSDTFPSSPPPREEESQAEAGHKEWPNFLKPTSADNAMQEPPVIEQSNDSPGRRSKRIAGLGAEIADEAREEIPEVKTHSPRNTKRVSPDQPAEPERPRKSPRKDSSRRPTATEGRSPTADKRQTRAQSKRVHPQVIIPAAKVSNRTKIQKDPTSHLNKVSKTQKSHVSSKNEDASKVGDIFEFHGSDDSEEVGAGSAATAAARQKEPVPTGSVQAPVRSTLSRGRKAKIKTLRSAPESSQASGKTRATASQRSTTKGVADVVKPAENVHPTIEETPPLENGVQEDIAEDIEATHTEAGVADGRQVEEQADEARKSDGDNEEADEDAESDKDGEEEAGEDAETEKGEDEGPLEKTGDPDLNRIFWFAEIGRREGRCRTADAKRIEDACTKASELIFDTSSTLQEVTETVKTIRSLLKTISDYDDPGDQKAFKADAFGHLFARLARLLEATHTWTKENFEHSISSVAPLRILHPLMRSMLALKDKIASWHVTIGQRYRGDPVIKEVAQNFITPLREVERKFALELKQAEQEEKVNKFREEAAARRRQREEEDIQKEEKERSAAQRRNTWHLLHVCRLECESSLDQRRRRHLQFRKVEDMEERDANGVRFEREPIFRNRQMPFAHRASLSEIDNWSDAQHKALIEGLQQHRGPKVFERIFQQYCRPGGVLRDFNVSEIIAQAAYFRTKTINAFQSNGWPVGDWVKQIPVLP
ncbi:hypothetical protein K491DRAFT_762620 [Lophiostoma macrostomum CBS 122681]|uniref:Uncharacterized protein n=1 Tax=Lophiostoma macrostomum CBS 122681 TaxID=1314788 RepID=A0A6A6SNJ4_9PLEO|nr:hypothetical protein K491DRAFT_762620 [Lophiostoma macrostomum CBS 122681]